MNRSNEASLVAANAFVMHYDSVLGKWIPSGASKTATIAKVQLLQNVTSNQFRIYAWNPINKEVLVNSVIYHNLRYQKAHATFHEWRDSDSQLVHGLNFPDTKEALLFGDVMTRVFKSLNLIYKQCKELQTQILASSSNNHYNKYSVNSEHAKRAKQSLTSKEQMSKSELQQSSSNNSNFSKDMPVSRTIVKSVPLNLIGKCYASISYAPDVDVTDREVQVQSPHDYENVDNVIANYFIAPSSFPGKTELSDKCQSLSDESVMGLKKQFSSASNGYATIASLTEQSSARTGVTLSFPVTSTTQNQLIADIKSMSEAEFVQAQSHSPSFESQLQDMIQLRKLNQSSRRNDSSVNLSFPQHNTKVDISGRTTDGISRCPFKDLQLLPPTDDIMSEIKLKLQRRKQIVDGHSDPNYSSSTDKSDVCISSASDTFSFVRAMDMSPDKIMSLKPFTVDLEVSNSVMRLYGNGDNSEDLKIKSNNKKRSFGDTNQDYSSNNTSASKHDLYKIQKEITDNFRKELMDVKKEVLDALRFLRKVS